MGGTNKSELQDITSIGLGQHDEKRQAKNHAHIQMMESALNDKVMSSAVGKGVSNMADKSDKAAH